MNVWDSAIEVFGPGAIDGGKGGRFVLLLPDCDGQLVTRRFPAAAMSFTSGCARFPPGDEGWD